MSAAICRRSASSCWFSRSTLARASLEMFFWFSRSMVSAGDLGFGGFGLFIAGQREARQLGVFSPAAPAASIVESRDRPRSSSTLPFSSLSRLVSSAIWRVSRFSAVSLPLDFLAGEVLRDHEDRHQERDDEQQRREHVDVARPELAVLAARPRVRPRAMPISSSARFNDSAQGLFSTPVTSACWTACSSTHSRTTFCSARIWRRAD